MGERSTDTISDKRQTNEKKYRELLTAPEMLFTLLFLYLELLFHAVRFGGSISGLLPKLLFSVLWGMILGLMLSVLSVNAGKFARHIVIYLITGYYVIQIIYSGVFHTYLSVSGSIGVTGQAFDFADVIWQAVRREWWFILLALLPAVLYSVILRKCFVVRERYSFARYAGEIGLVVAWLLMTLAILGAGAHEPYSPYEVYRDYSSVDMAVEKLGVSEALWLDVKNGIKEVMGIHQDDVSFVAEDAPQNDVENISDVQGDKDSEDSIKSVAVWSGHAAYTRFFAGRAGQKLYDTFGMSAPEVMPEAEIVDTSPNVLDIDLDVLAEKEEDDNIAAIHRYVNSLTPTDKNEYTGMFEGYNLIFVVAEGFSGYVIDKERTPTLYRMSREGFYFKHYYTPLWYGSTSGGEYADLTGLMPKNGGYLSMYKSGKNENDMMFTLSMQLRRQGYKVMGFHDNDYTYYDRNLSHPNLGYEWIGMGNGLTPERDADGTWLWPQSDLDMIEQTFDMYKDEEPFHVYYLTVSGHVMYNWGGNAMSARHKDITEELEYSETTKAYIACQYELELALTELNQKLAEAGLADNTLIVVTADHVPYDNKDVVDELAGEELDSTFDWYKNTLIIWSSSMKEPVTVDKYCSSLDILPTVSNLMGLPFDSRMMVGQDILSDSEGMVLFNDRSFITDRCSYNANTGEVRSIDGSKIDDNYVESKIAQVKNKFNMAENICDYDYYRYIDEAVYGTDR
ncbi:MAG: LTA synthase family protein [Wujia sp.]